MTQDIGDLKENNSEKDQQWERPPLGDFDEAKENICFQQIDAEEAMVMGKPAIRLFGVTEVNMFAIPWVFVSNNINRLDNRFAFTSLASNITSTLPLLSASPKRIATLTNIS